MSSKRERIHARRQAQQRNRILIITIVVVAALGITALFVWPLLNHQVAAQTSNAIVTPVPHTYPQANGNALGDPNAPVKITEFADFQCPYCEQFYQNTEQQVIDTYVATGKVYFVYRSVGAWIGPQSQSAAEAAYCAGDQNKFWQYHDMLFDNQTGENVGDFTDTHLTTFAQDLGLDMTAFNACYTSGKYASRVAQDAKDATAAGLTGTPGFAINGKVVLTGALPFASFQTTIEKALAGG